MTVLQPSGPILTHSAESGHAGPGASLGLHTGGPMQRLYGISLFSGPCPGPTIAIIQRGVDNVAYTFQKYTFVNCPLLLLPFHWDRRLNKYVVHRSANITSTIGHPTSELLSTPLIERRHCMYRRQTVLTLSQAVSLASSLP